MGDLFGLEIGFAAEVNATLLRSADSGLGALDNERALELRERAHDVQHKPPLRAARIYGIGEALEANSARAKRSAMR